MKRLIPVLFPVLAGFTAHSEERQVLFREDFNNLDNWKPLSLRCIDKGTSPKVELGMGP